MEGTEKTQKIYRNLPKQITRVREEVPEAGSMALEALMKKERFVEDPLARGKTPLTSAHLKDVEDLWSTHREVARLSVMGFKQQQIAERLGMTVLGVGQILKNPTVRNHIKTMNEVRDVKAVDVGQQLKGLASLAASKIEQILSIEEEEPSPSMLTIQLSAAKDVLDRAGFGAIRKSATVAKHTHSIEGQEEVLKRVRSRAIEVGLASGAIIDTSIQEIIEEEETADDSI